jgi:diguanylate cyclase (GGDEF)-like protein
MLSSGQADIDRTMRSRRGPVNARDGNGLLAPMMSKCVLRREDKRAMNDAIADTSRPPVRTEATLRSALLDSRQRWRDLVTMGADLAYETDEWGRFVFVIPEPSLGWSAATLIGQPAELLLVGGVGGTGFNPFRVTAPVRRKRVWLNRADGSAALFAFSAAPLFDSESRIVGVRGVGVDWTEYDEYQGRVATALRRGEVLDHILWRMSQEVLAPRMMQAALDTLMNALGAEGAAVIDLNGPDGTALVHRAGGATEEVLPKATSLLAEATGPTDATDDDGRPVLVAVCHTRFGAHAGLALWRSPGSRGWDHEDKLLVNSAASLIRMVLEHEAIQQEMVRQARTDPLTGLLNRRAFREEMARRIDRLDRDDQPGTLMFVDLDHFKFVNDRLGHEVGDQVLQRTANILRNTLRPSDLVARLGGDEFALWMDGADHMTAAERAERLCQDVPRELCEIAGTEEPTPTVSIGIASRASGSGEPVEGLIRRADRAMYEVKQTGRGHWRVAPAEEAI